MASSSVETDEDRSYSRLVRVPRGGGTKVTKVEIRPSPRTIGEMSAKGRAGHLNRTQTCPFHRHFEGATTTCTGVFSQTQPQSTTAFGTTPQQPQIGAFGTGGLGTSEFENVAHLSYCSTVSLSRK